jgi:hypothetical protein
MVPDIEPSKVFISYSHDSEEHKERVLELAQRLRADGLLSILDQFLNGHPAEGWPLWMERQIRCADFVLLVCTPTYCRRFMDEELPGKGLGSGWEAVIARLELYRGRGNSRKYIPVIFGDASEEEIPPLLRDQYNHYVLWKDYEALLRVLTSQPEVIPKPPGPRKKLPPKDSTATDPSAARTPSSTLSPSGVSILLPGTGPHLFGREEELRCLERAWDDPNTHVIVLEAFGGVGRRRCSHTGCNR